jgi:alpha-mannosidase
VGLTLRRGTPDRRGASAVARRAPTAAPGSADPCSLHSVGVRPEDSIRVGRIVRVLNEFVRPRRQGPSVPVEVAAYHLNGEPVPAAEAFAADYQPFPVGGSWGPAWDTTWFRIRGRIPAEWAGRPVAFGFRIGGAGSTGFGAEALVWRAGRPVQGLSPNHREHLLTADAAGGEDVEIFVEAAANPPSPFGANPWPLLLPDPDGAPLFTLQQADLHTRDPEFEEFWHDFRVLVDLLGELPDGEPRAARLFAGLERACNLLDLPDISGSWRRAHPELKALLAERPAPGTHAVAMVGHAHLDTAWLWPLRETVRKCARTFSTVLELMDRYPEYRFAVSQAQHLAWMRDHYPDLFERLKARIAEGRLEPTGSMWVEADCNIPSGESLVRQILFGKRFYLDEFGIETNDVWLPDVFGYSAALPQIMRRSGIQWFLTQKLSWNQYNVLPHHSFLWEGIDGSRVFTHFPPADTYNGNVSVRELRFAVENFKDHERANRSLYLFGWGDGGGGPTAEMLESARRLADLDGLPRLTMEGPRQFFSEAAAEIRDPAVWVGELYLELHRGTYTSQAATKLGNRRAEFALREAELWLSLAPDADYPSDKLDDLWKLLLLHQFHDIIPGSGIHWVYDDTARDHARILSETGRLVDDALASRVDDIDTSAAGHPVVIFNSLSHARRELVTVEAPADATAAVNGSGVAVPIQRDAAGRAIFEASVPACGHQVYDLVAANPLTASGVAADARSLENDYLRIEIDDQGLVSSIFDKNFQRQVLAPGSVGNRFQLHPDYPNFYDAWDIDRFAFDQVTDLDDAESVELVEDGPLRAGIRITRRFGDSLLTQVVRLSAGSPFVEFDTEVDWHETNRLLKVAFPVNVRSLRATYEIQFGHVERATHDNTSWDVARFEVCAHKWADLSEPGYGVALLNDCKYGYDISGNVMRLSLLRAPTWPDPEADRGHHHFVYRLLPHAADLREAGVIDAGYDLNVPLRTVATSPHPGALDPRTSILSVDAPHVVVEAVKRSVDDSEALVVRLYEAWGRRGPVVLRAPWAPRRAVRTDLLERDLADLPTRGDTVTVDLSPFEIVTLKLEPAET